MIEHILLLDVLKQGCQQHLVGFKAGEVCTRALSITLIHGGKALRLPEKTHAELYLIRPDGRKYHSTLETDTQKNKISHVMTSDELAVPGRMECEVRIQFPENDKGIIPVMYSPCFDILVEKTLYTENSAIPGNANSEWSKTLQRISDAEDKLDAHEKALTEKADRSDLDSKADKADLEAKADKAEVELKADKSELDGKADRADLERKADKSDLGDKVNAVPKTEEMTAEVGIDEEGRLWFDPKAWEELAITSFSVSPSGLLEKGSVLNSITVSWKANKKDVTAALYLGSIEKGRYSPEDGGAEKTVTLEGLNITYNPLAATPSVLLTVYNDRTAIGIVQKSQMISFASRVYMGAAISGYIDSDFIRALEKSKLSATRSMTETVTAGEGEYIYYACPTSYGTPVFKVGGFEGGFEKISEDEFTNAHGYTESYQVWRSTNADLGKITVTVS